MQRASSAFKQPLSFGPPSREDEAERPARSPDDPSLRDEIDDLTDPLKDETIFGETFYAWIVTLFCMAVVSLPFLYLIWRFRSVLAVLERGLGGGVAP